MLTVAPYSYLDPLPPEGRPCESCGTTGVCAACKGTGRSGFFLREPLSTAPSCSRCSGTARCPGCKGNGHIYRPQFEPDIHVETTLRTPTGGITVMGLMGDPAWRFLRIPRIILRRSFEAQRGWVTWRAQTHYREAHGQCPLFGRITGYSWRPSESVAVRIDVRGRRTGLV